MDSQIDQQLASLFYESPAILTLEIEERESLFKQISKASDQNKKKYIEKFLLEKERREKYEKEMEALLAQLKNSLSKLKSAKNKLAEAENKKNEEDQLSKLDNELKDI